ncbi:MAG: hypothetical protein V7707_10025 [Motiliproteus sp.]
MSRSMIALITMSLALLVPLTAHASCDLDYQICSKTCLVKHLNDDGAEAACSTKCVASKGVCLAEVGVDKTVEVSQEIWINTKSFVKEMTKE